MGCVSEHCQVGPTVTLGPWLDSLPHVRLHVVVCQSWFDKRRVSEFRWPLWGSGFPQVAKITFFWGGFLSAGTKRIILFNPLAGPPSNLWWLYNLVHIPLLPPHIANQQTQKGGLGPRVVQEPPTPARLSGSLVPALPEFPTFGNLVRWWIPGWDFLPPALGILSCPRTCGSRPGNCVHRYTEHLCDPFRGG